MALDRWAGSVRWRWTAAGGRVVESDAPVVAFDVMARGRVVSSSLAGRRGPDFCIARRDVLVRDALDPKLR